MRLRDGSWLRRPSPERIVTALGEPLVVVRRSVLTDLLAGALAAGTIESGRAATELVVDRPAASGSRCRTAPPARWTRSSARTAPARWWPATSTARCATAMRGTRPGAVSPRTRWIPIWRARPWARNRIRPRASRGRTHLLVRYRARARGRLRSRRRTRLPAIEVRRVGRTDSGAAGGHRRGRRYCATTSTTATRPVSGRADRLCVDRRRRPPDAATSGPGRLSGTGGCRDPGALRRRWR